MKSELIPETGNWIAASDFELSDRHDKSEKTKTAANVENYQGKMTKLWKIESLQDTPLSHVAVVG